MKGLLLTLISLFSLLTYSQGPIIEGTYLPVRGTRIEQVYDTTAIALDIPSKGENQVWDYSNKFVNILDTFNLATDYPEGTPHFNHFPEATHASFLNAPAGFGDSIWLYFVIDTAGLHNIGMFGKLGFGPDTIINMEPSELMIPSVITYGMEQLDTSTMSTHLVYNGMPALYKSKRFKSLKGEGYGSLSTPIGTFDDVVLGTEKIHSIDSVWYDLDSDGTYDGSLQLSDSYTVRYNFLRNNTFASSLLMELKTDENEQVIDYGWYTLPVDFGSLEGRVYEMDGGSSVVTDGEAYLYREYSNFNKNDILATTTIDVDGYYHFDSIPYGEYRIAARANLSMYNRAYTTYVGDTTNWLEATNIITLGDTSDLDITMKYYDDQLGSGTISGTLELDWGTGSRVGDPVPGIDIIVEEDPDGAAVVQTQTDGAGFFQFPTLEPGNYKLWVDVPGLEMAGTYNFTITADEEFPELNFTAGNDSIYPEFLLGTYELRDDLNLFSLHPNPTNYRSQIMMDLSETSDITIEVIDVAGRIQEKQIYNKVHSGTFRQEIVLDEKYVTGIYSVRVTVNNLSSSIRLIKLK